MFHIYRNTIQRLVVTVGKLSLVIINGIKHKGILKSVSFCSITNTRPYRRADVCFADVFLLDALRNGETQDT